jgi:hypothetical protein
MLLTPSQDYRVSRLRRQTNDFHVVHPNEAAFWMIRAVYHIRWVLARVVKWGFRARRH